MGNTVLKQMIRKLATSFVNGDSITYVDVASALRTVADELEQEYYAKRHPKN